VQHIHIRFLRFSAFYSPLLTTIGAGYLRQEGIEATYDVVTPERTTAAGIADGSVQVGQSAVAVSLAPWERGEALPFKHFALLNDRDGFFLAARSLPTPFDWRSLVGRPVIVDHFFQPHAMFREALRRNGVDPATVPVIDAGDVRAIERAYREGRADVVHMQGPAPQQLEADGLGTVVASVGEAVGPVAFSSLCASPEWLRTDVARAFVRAYRKGRAHAQEASPDEIAAIQAPFLPDVDRAVHARTVADYQRLGCWKGDIAIPRALYDRTTDIFLRNGDIRAAAPYDDVIAPLPS
jgi:NitT/TauT family transport system substrate-binding protein